ncbi:transposase, partial [Streptomyces rapamycinicus]
MDTHEVNRVRAKLALYVADVFASVPRKDQRAKGDCCLRGLMLDGRRKSIQAMASRLPDGNEQNLQQFVNQAAWDPAPVRRRICERMLPLVNPTGSVLGIRGGSPVVPSQANPAERNVSPKADREGSAPKNNFSVLPLAKKDNGNAGK